MSFYI